MPKLTSSHLKAIEHGVPLKISQQWILLAQFIFTFLVIFTALFLVVTSYNSQLGGLLKIEMIPIFAVFTFIAVVIFSLSDAIMVNGKLRLKNILGKPRYIDPTEIHLWYPFGPKADVLTVRYRSKMLIPHICIIIVSNGLRPANNVQRLLEHTQGPECVLRKPGHTI